MGRAERIYWMNLKVRVGWIGNPTRRESFYNSTQLKPLFSGWVVQLLKKKLIS